MFNWDVIEHEETHSPFEFEANGKKWRVPHVRDLTHGQKMALDMARVAMVLGEVTERWDPKAEEWVKDGKGGASLALGKRDDQLGPFVANWLAHAGLKPGESRASSR